MRKINLADIKKLFDIQKINEPQQYVLYVRQEDRDKYNLNYATCINGYFAGHIYRQKSQYYYQSCRIEERKSPDVKFDTPEELLGLVSGFISHCNEHHIDVNCCNPAMTISSRCSLAFADLMTYVGITEDKIANGKGYYNLVDFKIFPVYTKDLFELHFCFPEDILMVQDYDSVYSLLKHLTHLISSSAKARSAKEFKIAERADRFGDNKNSELKYIFDGNRLLKFDRFGFVDPAQTKDFKSVLIQQLEDVLKILKQK